MLNRFAGNAERKAGMTAGVPLCKRVGNPDEIAPDDSVRRIRQGLFSTGAIFHG